MSFIDTAMQILSLFILLFIGYIMNKKRVLDSEANTRMTKIILNITLPAQIVVAFVSEQGHVTNLEVVKTFGIAIVSYVLLFLLGVIFMTLLFVKKEQKGMYVFMMMFGNVGFMGFPVIQAILGQQAMIYAVIYNVIFNLLVYSIGIFLVNGADGQTTFQWKRLINMPFVSSVVSVLLYFLKIQIPDVVMTSFGYLSDVTTPLAMLLLGSVIAGMPIRDLVDDFRVYIFSIFKLILSPLLTIAFFAILPMETGMIKSVFILLAAMPVATNTTMLALEYDGDLILSSKGIFFTTLLSMITIPIVAMYC